MCGIAGIYNPSIHPSNSPDILKRMLARIQHRGPDESGIFLGQNIAMGNVRLSIIDLATGQQPIADEEGITYGISFIGCKKGQSNTEELKSVNGSKAEFELTDDIIFVRCQITSSKLRSNPTENMLYEMAWTQPVLNNH